jgi:hypothetical protein
VPWASREAAKPRMEMQRWVFGVRLAKWRTGVRGWVLSEARAFQPEICPLLRAARRLPLRGVGFACRGPHAKPRSREAAKGNAEVGVWCSFSRAADGSPWVGSFRSSGFPARDLSSATGCPQIAAAGRRVCVPWASREAAKGNAEVGVWCSVSQAADGSPWVASFRSSCFPARDLSSATCCLQIAAARRGGVHLWLHAKTGWVGV